MRASLLCCWRYGYGWAAHNLLRALEDEALVLEAEDTLFVLRMTKPER